MYSSKDQESMIEIWFTFWSASSHSTRSGVMGAAVMVTRPGLRVTRDVRGAGARQQLRWLCWVALVRWPQQSAA